MSNSADHPFSWEDLDRRLISPKRTELAEELHKRAADGEARIHFEVSQSGNSAGYLSRLFDFHEDLINEYAEKLYAIHCEACHQQNREISPEFIRAVRSHAVVTMIAARKSSVKSGVVQRGARTGKPPNPAALDKWDRRMDRLAHRWSRRLEAEAVACEYREAEKKPKDSPEPAMQPSPPLEPLEWERITPQHLIPAVKHIRESFDTSSWKYSTVTQKYCYAVLHPKRVNPSSIAPYKDAFATYRAIIGPAADKRFNDLCQLGTSPALFKAFFDALREGVEVEVRNEFDQFLEIGRANSEALNTHPVEWAKAHLQILIRAEAFDIRRWIKEACDKQDKLADPGTGRDIDELMFWKAWRAPRLIHMQPSGNTAYDHATEWTREDEPRTQSLLDSLSRRFLQFLEIDLDQTVGGTYVKLAKNTEAPGVLKPRTQPQPRPVTQAPRPPVNVLSGSGFVPRGPEPSQPLLDFPTYYPNHFQPRTSVVIGEAVKKFSVQIQILDLLKCVISGLTPDFSAAVREKTLRPDLALSAMADLMHSLSVYNSARNSDTFRLEQDVRRSDEWLMFAKEIADGGSVTPEKPEDTSAAEQKAGGSSQSYTHGATTWDGIEVEFISEERVQVRNGAHTQSLNYAEFGFEDSRNGKPNRAWVVLRIFAERRGMIRQAAEAGQNWSKVEKRIQEIRRVFRAHFGISADPIPFIEGTGYRASFKIGCRPSYEV